MTAEPLQRSAKIDLTSGSLTWHLFRMAGPTAAGILLHSAYSLVDAFWLGKLGKVALAAPGVTGPLLFVAVALGFGLGAGGTALVSQYTGAGQHRQADRAAGQTMLLLCTVGVFAALPMIALAPWILRLLLVPTEVIPGAAGYLRIFMLGLPFMAFAMAYSSVLRALGDTVTAVVIGIVANLLNLLLDPLLIFGLGGLPALGVKGAALASVIAQCASAVGCLLCMAGGRAGLHVARSDLAADWPLIRRMVSVAVPASIGHGFNSVGFVIFQTIINSLGTTVVSAFTIGFRVLHFFNAPMHAMSSAAAPIVGQALGAGKVPLARRAVRLSAGILASVMLVPTAFLMLKGQLVARLFVQDADVIAESGRFFCIVPASSYFFGVVMVLMAAFYGSGHTRPAMVVSILRVAGVRLPAAFFLAFVMDLGSVGAYAGMVAGNVVCALMALWLFLKGGWERGLVPAHPLGDAAPEGAQGGDPFGRSKARLEEG